MPEPTMGSDPEISISQRGITIHWKTVLPIVVTLLGGGTAGVGIWNVATQDKVNSQVETFRDDSSKMHEELKAQVEEHSVILTEHTAAIETMSENVESIQSIQRKQFAREEARRITEEIPERHRRERAYDRLVDQNMRRLKSGKDPCSNVSCAN